MNRPWGTGPTASDPASTYVSMPSGIAVPERVADEILHGMARPKPTAIDLFCGCGGFSLGLIKAGFEVVCAVDNSPDATMTYLCNLGQWPMRIHFTDRDARERLEKTLRKSVHTSEAGVATMPFAGEARPSGQTPVRSFIFGDIRDVTGDLIADVAGIEVGEVDLLAGSPPCQGFSLAGKRDPKDPRSQLVFEMSRLILELNPKTICMENVPEIANMVTAEGMPVVDQFCRALDAGGYASYEALRKMMGLKPDARAAMRGGKLGRKQAQTDNGQGDLF